MGVAPGGERLGCDLKMAWWDLMPGDFIDISAHRRHRVEWTTPEEPTIWLAVFYSGSAGVSDTC